MKVVERIAELREALDAARADGRSVGFVPTMGFFHEGHRSLMRAARAHHDVVVVSLFVNPLQFGAGEDLERYPRDLERDAAQAEAEGVDLLFAPSVEEMYPEPVTTTVHVSGVSEGMCGGARPGHFDGVATVVTKLFSIVGPCSAYFGRKDFQQLAVVRRLAADLDLPVRVVGCPLVREPDGLAMSSRNAYLSAGERQAATVLHRALSAVGEAASAGQCDVGALRAVVSEVVGGEPTVDLEYVEIRRASDLGGLERLEGEAVAAVAARVGATRLIDNMVLAVDGERVSCDLGVIAAGVGQGRSACAER